jgi:uncharacterized repeat protein (TIGR01451 family)
LLDPAARVAGFGLLLSDLPGHETGNSFWQRSTVMKTVSKAPGLFARLGLVATALLLGQQALAAGTDPGTAVDNRATVTYSVGGTPQTGIESSPTGNNLPGVNVPGGGADTSFLVDRRVDFTISQVGGSLTQVAPGQNGVFVEFYVTNTSNGVLDFIVSPTNLTSAFGDVRGVGTTDSDVDMNAIRIAVSAAPDGQPGGGNPGDGPAPVDPGTGAAPGDTLIDNLPEDDSIRVRIYADTPGTLLNGQIANVLLSATAADPATSAALVETPGADDPTVVENVFANASGADINDNATESEADGFQVVSAALVITKIATVISDPFGSGKALPDAVIEYTITIDNTAGAQDATGVVIDDVVDPDVTLENGVYNSGASNVSYTGGFCNADGVAGDGCTFNGGTGALSIAVPDIPQGTTMTVQFQVRIPPT